MRTLTQADREIAANIARARRLNAGDVTKATPVRMLGDARFAKNDEPDAPAVAPSVYRVMATESQLANMEDLGGWIESMYSERQMSAYFGPISTRDLIAKMMFNDRATAEQVLAAVRELKDRYVTEFAPLIAQEMLRLQADDERSGRERAEFDARTVGVKGRAA